MKRVLPVIAAAVVAAFDYSIAAEPKSFKINIINSAQQEVGQATLTETPTGLLIQLELLQNPPGIAAGPHAIHIHEIGKCEPPFKSAGGHFNPSAKKHGFLVEQGKHMGDLPNIHVAQNAPLIAEFLVPQLGLSKGDASIFDSDGSALVIHEGADDYHTDPAGDSGDRVACGVIKQSRQQNK